VRVLLYVQHLLGSGHLQRTALIGAALKAGGAECWLISGGMPVANIETGDLVLRQLPPLRANDATFEFLVDADGAVASAAYLAERQQQLLDIAADVRPDIVLIESWPFGRRKQRHELTALLRQVCAQSRRPLVVCSIRDILQRGRKAKRLRETVDHINRWFDYVLVHADSSFVELDYSFELAGDIKPELIYTGFVVRPGFVGRRWQPGNDAPVLVSAGGGAVGLKLYRCAIESARLANGDFQWHLLIGRGVSQADKDQLQFDAPESVKIEWARSDFPDLLRNAGVSISQSGYNTTMDLLGVGCPAIVVPFDGAGETEQRDRAERLATLGIARLLTADELSPQSLLDGVRERYLKAPERWQADFNGTENTAKWLLDAARSRA